jgi:uncharacterized protein
MKLSFNPQKNATNITERGLPFTMVEQFDWSRALIVEDSRIDYGEKRYQALGYIETHLYMLVFTPREQDGLATLHVISLRKANQRERKRYETHHQP